MMTGAELAAAPPEFATVVNCPDEDVAVEPVLLVFGAVVDVADGED